MKESEATIRERIPIRRRFMRTVLLTTIISILAVSIVGILCIRWIRSSSEKTLMEQLAGNLKNVIHEQVNSVDAKLAHFEKNIEFIRDFIDNMYSNEEAMIASGKMIFPPEDTSEYALTRAFASDTINASDMRKEILFLSNLEEIWDPLLKENEDLITTSYIGTKDGLLISYDKYSYMSCPPEGKELIYNYYYSEWYKRGMNEDGIFYTPVYMDSQGRGLTITIGSGFKDKSGETAGVICMDFDLTALYSSLFSTDLDNGTFTFAMDNAQTIIADNSDVLDLKDYTGLSQDDLDRLKADPDGTMEINDSIYVCVPMERIGWKLCACVPKETVQKSIHAADSSIGTAILIFALIVLLILLFAVLAVNKFVSNIIHPLEVLGKDIKIISDGDLSYRAAVLRNDEIGDITSGMNEMVDSLNFTLNELISSQKHADKMSRLATLDSLTGIRNKTAFDGQSEILAEELNKGKKEFGFVMVDLNNLKLINDNFGHDKGNIAIKALSALICDVFAHSPVFRVGGDEFVVILKDEDYNNIESLVKTFKERDRSISENKNASPWERISSAIGYALYDESLDTGVESVLTRADEAMYSCKSEMKGQSYHNIKK